MERIAGHMVNNRGMTLIEILLVAAIIGIISALAPKFIMEMIQFSTRNALQIQLQKESRIALGEISRLIRSARKVSILISSPSGQPPFSKIVFQVGGSATVTIEQDGRQLKINDGSGPKIYTDKLVDLAFGVTAANVGQTVSVSLSLQELNGTTHSDVAVNLQESIGVMN